MKRSAYWTRAIRWAAGLTLFASAVTAAAIRPPWLAATCALAPAVLFLLWLLVFRVENFVEPLLPVAVAVVLMAILASNHQAASTRGQPAPTIPTTGTAE